MCVCVGMHVCLCASMCRYCICWCMSIDERLLSTVCMQMLTRGRCLISIEGESGKITILSFHQHLLKKFML